MFKNKEKGDKLIYLTIRSYVYSKTESKVIEKIYFVLNSVDFSSSGKPFTQLFLLIEIFQTAYNTMNSII